MPSTTSIPQEIYDYIIDEAHDDRDTLKACSLVSQSFLPTSRKNLFYAITIDSEAGSQGLFHLLFSNPAISSYARRLTIVPHPKLLPYPGVPWAAQGRNLASILHALPQIRQLQLGDDSSHPFDWTCFPPTVRLALQTQVHRLPCLSALNIHCISELPVTLLFAPVKQLSLVRVNIAGTDTDVPKEPWINDSSMAQLESLDVQVYDFRENSNVTWPLLFQHALNLRQLSVSSMRNGTDYELRVTQQLIETAAKSLNSIAWLVYDDELYPVSEHFRWTQLNLGPISNLTALSFTFTSLSMNEDPLNFKAVVKMLKDSCATRNLEDLTFAFEMTYVTCMWESRVILCSRYDAWVEFNHTFESGPGIPMLRNLKIYLHLTEPPLRAADIKLQVLLMSKLPALDKQVTMLCKTYSNSDRNVWKHWDGL